MNITVGDFYRSALSVKERLLGRIRIDMKNGCTTSGEASFFRNLVREKFEEVLLLVHTDVKRIGVTNANSTARDDMVISDEAQRKYLEFLEFCESLA